VVSSDAQAGPVVGRLVFDGQCGFCTRCVHWLERIDRHGRIDLRPYQAPGAPASVGAREDQCGEAVQWRGPDGVRRSGADAVNAVLDVVTGTRVPSTLYRASAGLQERAYRWIAEHRSHLPGVTPHCQQHPETCG
jgi:predicted DCC family thiol-disulfide oxidoreductase YuxK